MTDLRAEELSGSFAAAAALVRERTGLVFSDARRVAFERAVMKGVRQSRSRDLEDYLGRLSLEPSLLDDLVAEITVGETYFFREPRQLDFIRNEVLAELRARRLPGHRLRIWSVGCASGEEPYTMAIIARQIGLAPPPHIVGTDLSRSALARAVRGRYSRWSFRGVAEDVVETFFQRRNDQFELAPALRASVDFGFLNLVEDSYPSFATGIWGMDLILCRNVLIYFDSAMVARVARRLMDALAEGGWLFLGASDPMLADMVPCDVVITPAGLAYRKEHRDVAQYRPDAVPPPVSSPGPVEAPALSRPSSAAKAEAVASVSPTLADARRHYAAHNYEQAVEVASRVVHQNGDDPAAWTVLVRSLANQGDLHAAGRTCAAAVERHRTSAELHYLHAVLLTESGRPADAARAARGAVYLDRELVVAHVTLGSALARVGDREGARRAFRNAERLLGKMDPAVAVPGSDGEPAGRLATMVRLQLQLLPGGAAR